MKKNNYIFTLVFSALCLAIGIAIKNLTFFLPIGIPILKISFDGPAFRLVAVLFGPLYGGIIGALADFVGFFLTNKSGNAWIPFLTVTYALNMALVGFLWRYFKKKSAKTVRFQYLVVIGLILVYGLISLTIGIKKQPEVVSVAGSQAAIAEFNQKLHEQSKAWTEENRDTKSLDNLLSEMEMWVNEGAASVSEQQLKEALSIVESVETKAFEGLITKTTRQAVGDVDALWKEVEPTLDDSLKAEVKELVDAGKKALKAPENEMKAAREIRRQVQGSAVVLLVAFLGIVIYLVNQWIAKNQEIKGIADNFLQMFLTIFIPGILFNWVNTYILFMILFQNQKKDIYLFGFFRSAVNLVEVYYNTLIVLFLIALLNPLLKKRGIFSIQLRDDK